MRQSPFVCTLDRHRRITMQIRADGKLGTSRNAANWYGNLNILLYLPPFQAIERRRNYLFAAENAVAAILTMLGCKVPSLGI